MEVRSAHALPLIRRALWPIQEIRPAGSNIRPGSALVRSGRWTWLTDVLSWPHV